MGYWEFADRFWRSLPTVWRVGWWLNSWGWEVTFPPPNLTPTPAQWQEYTDKGDLLLSRKRLRCEVKHSSRDFTCRADWRLKTFIAMAREPWERADPKPHAIFMVNKAETHVASVRGDTSDRWTIREKHDSVYGKKLGFMMAPLDCVQWDKLELKEPPTRQPLRLVHSRRDPPAKAKPGERWIQQSLFTA